MSNLKRIPILSKKIEKRKKIWKFDAKNLAEKNSRDYFIAGSFQPHDFKLMILVNFVDLPGCQ